MGLEKEMSRARQVYAAWGRDLLANPVVEERLSRYGRAIGETGELFVSSGAAAACAACGQAVPGGCCFEGLEENYDWLLLLINLLFDRSLPEGERLPGQCLFVGPRGCRLRAKFAFCLNYFCPDIRASLGLDRVHELVFQVGREVLAGLELEAAVRDWLKKRGIAALS